MAEHRRNDTYERVYLGLAITITSVWVIATLVQIVLPNHVVPTYANIVMLSVASAFFGGAVIRARQRVNGNGNGKQAIVNGEEQDPYEGPGGYYRADR